MTKNEFIVQRSKWCRGDNSNSYGESLLLNRDGFMCCLGFCARQLGAQDEQILNAGDPEDAIRHHPELDLGIFVRKDADDAEDVTNSSLTCRAIEVNDDPGLDDNEREIRLSNLFSEFGLSIRFEG